MGRQAVEARASAMLDMNKPANSKRTPPVTEEFLFQRTLGRYEGDERMGRRRFGGLHDIYRSRTARCGERIGGRTTTVAARQREAALRSFGFFPFSSSAGGVFLQTR